MSDFGSELGRVISGVLQNLVLSAPLFIIGIIYVIDLIKTSRFRVEARIRV